MRIEAVFGVQAANIDEAKSMLDILLNTTAEARESSGYGDYFLYRGSPRADVYLIANEDPESGEPQFEEASEWRVLLRVVGGSDDDPWLLAIKGNSDQFTPVIYDEFE
jgi:hypothetical protein